MSSRSDPAENLKNQDSVPHAAVDETVRKRGSAVNNPTNLCLADLCPTDLCSAHLRPADLRPTSLYPTDLRPTSLYPTDLRPTSLYPTDLRPTSLYPTDLRPTSLYPTDLRPGGRFVFELAGPKDGAELLEILEEEEFKGQISLLYTRRPDAYESLLREGGEVLIAVCRDTKAGRIAGFGACAIREQYVDGRPERTGYLFGLRSRKEYRRIYGLLPKGYAFLRSRLEDRGIKLFYTSILDDNAYALDLFTKRRPYMPLYEDMGIYTVYILKTRGNRRRSEGPLFLGPGRSWEFGPVRPNQFAEVVEFLEREGNRKQLFPVMKNLFAGDTRDTEDAEDVANAGGPAHGPDLSAYRTLRDSSGNVIGVGSAWDQRSYKQYILQGLSGYLKWAQKLSFILPVLGYPAIPEEGAVVDFFTLSFWAVKDDDPSTFRALLEGFSQVSGDYVCFAVGLHESDALGEVMKDFRHISYKSRLKQLSWDPDKEERKIPGQGRVLHLECGEL